MAAQNRPLLRLPSRWAASQRASELICRCPSRRLGPAAAGGAGLAVTGGGQQADGGGPVQRGPSPGEACGVLVGHAADLRGRGQDVAALGAGSRRGERAGGRCAGLSRGSRGAGRRWGCALLAASCRAGPRRRSRPRAAKPFSGFGRGSRCPGRRGRGRRWRRPGSARGAGRTRRGSWPGRWWRRGGRARWPGPSCLAGRGRRASRVRRRRGPGGGRGCLVMGVLRGRW